MPDRIVAIRSGGDWNDASCNHVVVPVHLDLDNEHARYRRWYKEEYCSELHLAGGRVPYMTFVEWLKSRCGAEEALIEEFGDI